MSVDQRFKGVGVAIVTPFDEKLDVDYDAYVRLLGHVSEGGVDDVVVQGTTGESTTVNPSEKKELLKLTKQNNPRKLPIVYGIGGNDTQSVLKSIAEADFDEVDALLSVTPYYNKPSQA